MTRAAAEIQAQVDRLLDRVAHMTDAELLLMRSAWEDQDGSARERAWATVRRHPTRGLLDAARDRVAAWVNNYPAPMVIGDVPALFSYSGMDPGSVRRAAIPPILDALAATVAADALSADDHATLLAPLSRLEK